MLMGALYNKLHRALFDLQATDLGVSFPSHKHGVSARTLGDHMRLHGTHARLEQLMGADWLTGMRDHTQVSELLAVPDNAQAVPNAMPSDTTFRKTKRSRFTPSYRHGALSYPSCK